MDGPGDGPGTGRLLITFYLTLAKTGGLEKGSTGAMQSERAITWSPIRRTLKICVTYCPHAYIIQ